MLIKASTLSVLTRIDVEPRFELLELHPCFIDIDGAVENKLRDGRSAELALELVQPGILLARCTLHLDGDVVEHHRRLVHGLPLERPLDDRPQTDLEHIARAAEKYDFWKGLRDVKAVRWMWANRLTWKATERPPPGRDA